MSAGRLLIAINDRGSKNHGVETVEYAVANRILMAISDMALCFPRAFLELARMVVSRTTTVDRSLQYSRAVSAGWTGGTTI